MSWKVVESPGNSTKKIVVTMGIKKAYGVPYWLGLPEQSYIKKPCHMENELARQTEISVFGLFNWDPDKTGWYFLTWQLQPGHQVINAHARLWVSLFKCYFYYPRKNVNNVTWPSLQKMPYIEKTLLSHDNFSPTRRTGPANWKNLNSPLKNASNTDSQF